MEEYLGNEKPVNQTRPLVSVCVVTYNHALFIRECLTGILNQRTSFPIEIIVGEDESSDGTRDICKELAKAHPDKIRLFLRRKEDKIFIFGMKSGSFNFIECVNAARGEFIALCDGDDYWTDDNKLQAQYDFLSENPDYSLHYFPAITSEKEISHPCGPKTFGFLDSLENGKYGPAVNVFLRSAALDGVNLKVMLKDVINGDWVLECLGARMGFGYVGKEPTSIYRIHPGSATNQLNSLGQSKFLSRLMFTRNLINSGIELDADQAKVVRSRYRHLFLQHFKRGTIFQDRNKWLTVKAFMRSISGK